MDAVNSPPHYNVGGVECIEAIRASMSPQEYLGYLKGSTLKYLWRYQYKANPAQDLAKARWYLNRLEEEYAVQQRQGLLEETKDVPSPPGTD